MNRKIKLTEQNQGFCISFSAMASPCEVLVQTLDVNLVNTLAKSLTREVWRIEDKFSRYDANSTCSLINRSGGKPTKIDNETFLLLNFAAQCFELSHGLFDITAGVLNRAWQFDGSDNIASQSELDELLPLVGWGKVIHQQNSITLPKEMALDFGGIAKEYAVDRCILLAKEASQAPVLVNLGGDLAVTGPRLKNQPWQVAIEAPKSHSLKINEIASSLTHNSEEMIVTLFDGALATSGDSKRYLYKQGRRYSHVLNPMTGWPIENAPRSITTLAPQCIQAGMLATLALLQGSEAESFLDEQEITHWLRV